MNKIIVNLTKERIVFIDFNNPPFDDGNDYVEMPYHIDEKEILNDAHNHFIFKDIMNDYNKRIDAQPIITFRFSSNKSKLKNKIKELTNKRLGI